MSKIKPVKAWAVVDPHGIPRGKSVTVPNEHPGVSEAELQDVSIFNFLDDQNGLKSWTFYKSLGYRCIPVTLTPEGEPK